jgi:hypothetical protein
VAARRGLRGSSHARTRLAARDNCCGDARDCGVIQRRSGARAPHCLLGRRRQLLGGPRHFCYACLCAGLPRLGDCVKRLRRIVPPLE